jgi:hypothetical protein
MGYTHNKGYSATSEGFAVGEKGNETNIINGSGVFDIPSQAISGSRFVVTYPQVAAADVAKTFFIAPFACKVVSAYERHVTVAGQAGTLTIEKLNTGEAPGAGDVVLASAWDLTSAANTPVSKAAVTDGKEIMVAGDALCLKLASGAATSYALGTISVLMEVV